MTNYVVLQLCIPVKKNLTLSGITAFTVGVLASMYFHKIHATPQRNTHKWGGGQLMIWILHIQISFALFSLCEKYHGNVTLLFLTPKVLTVLHELNQNNSLFIDAIN